MSIWMLIRIWVDSVRWLFIRPSNGSNKIRVVKTLGLFCYVYRSEKKKPEQRKGQGMGRSIPSSITEPKLLSSCHQSPAINKSSKITKFILLFFFGEGGGGLLSPFHITLCRRACAYVYLSVFLCIWIHGRIWGGGGGSDRSIFRFFSMPHRQHWTYVSLPFHSFPCQGNKSFFKCHHLL